jgi:hypothetical protein
MQRQQLTLDGFKLCNFLHTSEIEQEEKLISLG